MKIIRKTCILIQLFATLTTCTAIAQDKGSISATISASPGKLYVKQTFDLTLTVRYSNITIGRQLNLESVTDNPAFIMIDDFKNLPVRRQGNAVIQQFRCQARVTESGRIKLTPTLQIGVIERRRAFIGYTRTEVLKRLTVQPVELNVLPLPEKNRPDSFTGAVGNFSYSVKINNNDITVGDLIKTTTTIEGKGYLDKIRPPRFSPGRHFKVYDPRLMPGSTRDRLVIEQTLVPMSTNAAALPEISFNYFDPIAEKYQELTAGPFQLKFHKQQTTEYQHFRPDEDPTAQAGQDTTNRTDSAEIKGQEKVLTRILSSFRKSLAEYPSASMIRDDKARLAPASSALATFDLPARSTVTVLQLHDQWAKIELGRKRGWVPLTSLTTGTISERP